MSYDELWEQELRERDEAVALQVADRETEPPRGVELRRGLLDATAARYPHTKSPLLGASCVEEGEVYRESVMRAQQDANDLAASRGEPLPHPTISCPPWPIAAGWTEWLERDPAAREAALRRAANLRERFNAAGGPL